MGSGDSPAFLSRLWLVPGVVESAAGELQLPSGRVAACDPLTSLANAPVFARAVAAGTYRVFVGVMDGDVAWARLALGDGPAARWEPGAFAAESPREGVPGYGVDSGTGCFVDAGVAARWREHQDRLGAEVTKRIAAAGIDPHDGERWHEAYQRILRELDPETLHARLNAAGLERGFAASVPLDGGNLVAFRTGAGDGVYASFWGLDGGGAPVALVTDFGLVREDEEDEDGEDAGPEPEGTQVGPLFVAALKVVKRLRADGLLETSRRFKDEAAAEALLTALSSDEPARLGEAVVEALLEVPGVEEVFADDAELERRVRPLLGVIR